MSTVTERDNYKMPELFTGEITPEIKRKVAQNKVDIEKRKAKLKAIYKKRNNTTV